MKLVLVILFHLLPIVPFVLGQIYLGIASILLVALPYIKSAKFTVEIQTLEAASETEKEGTGVRLEAARISRRRWEALTLLDYWRRIAEPESSSRR